MKTTKSRQNWGVAAAVTVLLGIGLWLALGRSDAPQPTDTSADKLHVSRSATLKTGARTDSTTTLLSSDKAVVVGTSRDEQGHGAGAAACAWSDQDELRGPNTPDVEPEDVVFELVQACGLAGGDRIVEVDGLAVSGLDSHRHDKLIAAPPGTVLELTLKAGKMVSLELGPPLDW